MVKPDPDLSLLGLYNIQIERKFSIRKTNYIYVCVYIYIH